MIGELLVSDIMENIDPAQYANQQGVSLQHYLIKMINVILTDTDNSKKGEANAVIASFIDWKEAFPRQCPKLGVEEFTNPSFSKLSAGQNNDSKMEW